MDGHRYWTTCRMRLTHPLRLFVVSLCLLVAGAACAQTAQRAKEAVFEARAATFTPMAGWHKTAFATQSGTLYLAPTAFLTNSDVANATARTDALGRALVVLGLKPASHIKLMAATARQENTHIALLVNGNLVATVPAKGPMTGGRLAIEGFRHSDEAKQLADTLNALVR